MEEDHLEAAAAEEKFSFDLLLAVFQKLPDAIVILNEDRKIFRVNPQAELLFGYNEIELKNKPIEILVPDSLKERHTTHTQTYVDSPSLRAMGSGIELKAKRKNGTEIPVEINLSPVSTVRGLYVIAVIRRKVK